MAYVPVPKDLSKIKTKVLFNLTRRQLVCFTGGALLGVPLFFLLRDRIGVSSASMVMILVMVPAFLLAMYEKNGQPLEKLLRNIVNVLFLRPKRRPYKTNNFYAVLERQQHLDTGAAGRILRERPLAALLVCRPSGGSGRRRAVRSEVPGLASGRSAHSPGTLALCRPCGQAEAVRHALRAHGAGGCE